MTEPTFAKVAVIGAGTMGQGIALVCAQAGSEVRLQDVTQQLLDRGIAKVREFLDRGVEKSKTTPAQRDAIVSRLRPVLALEDAVRGADLVVEAAPEDLALKQKLFGEAARHCGAYTVLATNTSSLRLRDVFAGVQPIGRCLGMHFFNPPPLMPLLEVVRMRVSDDHVVEKVLAYAKDLGKEPIVVRDSPGFASSRLGVVLGLEAIRMVEEDVASPEDIDKAMELGYRHPMGPLKLTDLVGLDVRMAIADYLRQALDNPAFEVPALMRQMVAEGKVGKKAGQGFYKWE